MEMSPLAFRVTQLISNSPHVSRREREGGEREEATERQRERWSHRWVLPLVTGRKETAATQGEMESK